MQLLLQLFWTYENNHVTPLTLSGSKAPIQNKKRIFAIFAKFPRFSNHSLRVI